MYSKKKVNPLKSAWTAYCEISRFSGFLLLPVFLFWSYFQTQEPHDVYKLTAFILGIFLIFVACVHDVEKANALSEAKEKLDKLKGK